MIAMLPTVSEWNWSRFYRAPEERGKAPHFTAWCR
jgi:hypothetical protein